MSDYFDLIEQELRLAVRRRAHLPLHTRLRRRHSRALLVACACVAVGGPAIAAAAGAFRTGPPVPASVPARPDFFNGVAIAASVRVLPLRVADPLGGPAWGLRFDRTTRGLLCVQPGRVVGGQVGVLGIDDAFADDGRFHPFSDDYVEQFGCGDIDGAGHAFAAPMVFGLPASALAQTCVPGRVSRSSSGVAREVPAGRGPICPDGALRNVSYGMLGPDAVSYSYTGASGNLVTRPTSGPDGAFLIVAAASNPCAARGFCGGTLIGADPAPGELIRRITYRSGRTCSLPAHYTAALHADHCPSVGYVTPPAQRLSAAAVRSPLSVRDLGLQHLCASATNGESPCGAHPSKRAKVEPGPRYYIVKLGFTARAAAPNVNSGYGIWLRYPRVHGPRCQIGGAGGATIDDLTAGQRVVSEETVPGYCGGTFHLYVSFRQAGVNSLPVGSATFTLPRRR